ncbi:hypothetical protein [Actinomycetospora cinnamomea]|uniref:Uncharacterized protein n=1 Tax=Actinomycetospora cinnamomea TaxID=663609 RepID=A0A2U1EXB7_9PSEU|nr:hypothetical protein [Actinomycetospora cinnamomea]PVZ04551.1 hypothetical protein C8D89_1174 [Actinomycetospora cinnamomea]
MWGISIPINLFTVLAVLFAPLFFLLLVAKAPWVGLLFVAVVVAVIARRRVVRRRQAEAEEAALDAERRAWAKAQADEFARRWGEPWR